MFREGQTINHIDEFFSVFDISRGLEVFCPMGLGAVAKKHGKVVGSRRFVSFGF
jgi:hypothetical protein